MQKDMSYNALSRFYDAFNYDIDYKKIAKKISGFMKNRPDSVVADLCCGTGGLSLELLKLGYDVISIDYNEKMLEAAGKKIGGYEKALLIKQDIRNLDLYGTVDIFVCLFDGINHLDSLKDVKKAFRCVDLFLHPDGKFIFDINTTLKFNTDFNNTVFCDELDNCVMIWKNYYNKKNQKCDMELSFFEKDVEKYTRYDDHITEKCFETEQITQALNGCNLKVIKILDGDTFAEFNAGSKRAMFITEKITKNF